MPWFATKSAHTAERRVSAFKRTQWISGYIQNMNACLEPGAVEQSSYSVNIQIQKTAAGWCWCRGLWPPGGGVWLAVSSRLVQRDTVRSSGYLQPYSYFYHLHSVSHFIALQSAHTFYVEHTYLTMCGLTVLRIWQILWRWYLHLQSNAGHVHGILCFILYLNQNIISFCSVFHAVKSLFVWMTFTADCKFEWEPQPAAAAALASSRVQTVLV